MLPMAVPAAAIALAWKILLCPDGCLNQFLTFLTGEGWGRDWVNGDTAFPILVGTYLWKNIGYDMLLWLAGLSAVPEGLYDAAKVDGAGVFARMRHGDGIGPFPCKFIPGLPGGLPFGGGLSGSFYLSDPPSVWALVFKPGCAENVYRGHVFAFGFFAVLRGSQGCSCPAAQSIGRGILAKRPPRHIFIYREVWVMGQPSGQDRKAKWACLKSPLYMAKWAAACGAKGVMPRRPAHRRQRKGDLWAIWHKLRKAASSSLSWQRLLF